MFSRSLSAARVTIRIRDFFQGSLSHRRRGKKSCWEEQVDEWGRTSFNNKVPQEQSNRETSDETFFTSYSVQSNITDVSMPSEGHAVIRDGPQRTVDVQHVSILPESYPKIEDDAMCSGVIGKPSNAGEAPKSPGRPQSHLNGQQTRPKAPECRIQKDQPCNDGRRCKSSDWRITDSTLFAYNAMSGCSHAEKTNLYTWLKGHDRNCGPESDCSLLLWKLEAHDLNSSCADGDKHEDRRVFSVPRPSYEATTRWGGESRLHGDGGPTPRAGSEGNFAARHSQADCSFYGGYNSAGIRLDLQDLYISDSEDSGRISPDTFRLWTTDCAKVGNNSRQTTEDRDVHNFESAFHRTADNLTPDDSTIASISSISSDKHHEIQAWQHKLSLHAAPPTTTTSHRLPNKVYTLTLPEVQSALTHPLAPATIHTIPLSQYTSALSRRASFLASSEPHMAQLARTRSHLYGRISTLQENLDSITAHASNITRRRHPLRTEADRRQQSEREDIYAYLEDYMCRLDAECNARHDKLHRLAREIDKLRKKEDNLRDMIEAVGQTVGVGVEEVNGNVDEMETLVRLIDEGEMEILSRQGHHGCC